MIEKLRNRIIKKYYNYSAGQYIDRDALIFDIFRYQSQYNIVYKKFLDYLKIDAGNVKNIEEIPFLPVSLFKKHKIITGEWKEELIFESSATTGMIPSKNHIREPGFYYKNAMKCFEDSFGRLEDYCFFALLPSYMERQTSSLIFMVDYFIKKTGCGGFYKYNYDEILSDIKSYNGKKKKILFGVTYALLEMAKKYHIDLHDVIVMETGGMKGRGKELQREEVHDILKKSFNINKVFSEYGMTELMSQAYSFGEGIYRKPLTMEIIISDIYDPFDYLPLGRQGKINIIDLANIDTCSFIATDDLGILIQDDEFKVLGRTDESDVRGCNLLFY